MNMKNRFQWSDKQDVKNEGNTTIIVKSAIPHYPGEQDEEGYVAAWIGEINELPQSDKDSDSERTYNLKYGEHLSPNEKRHIPKTN